MGLKDRRIQIDTHIMSISNAIVTCFMRHVFFFSNRLTYCTLIRTGICTDFPLPFVEIVVYVPNNFIKLQYPYLYEQTKLSAYMYAKNWFLFDFVRLLVVWGFEFENVFIHVHYTYCILEDEIGNYLYMTNDQCPALNKFVGVSVWHFVCARNRTMEPLDKPKIYRKHS